MDDAVAVTDALDTQPAGTPVMTGSVGGVRSIMAADCTHADALPTASRARNRTSVWPSPVIVAVAPGDGADQVAPPSVDVSDW